MKKLHGILKATFEEVSRLTRESKHAADVQQPNKRKSAPANGIASKRFRAGEEPIEPDIEQTESFGASRLGLDE